MTKKVAIRKYGAKRFVVGALAVLAVGLGPSLASAETLPEGLSERSMRKMARARKNPNRPKATTLASVCRKTSPVSGFLIKNAWPGHIQKSDSRASGFALVCASICPKKFPINIYHSDGSLAAKLGYYGRWEGNGKPRLYCGAGGVGSCSASRITQKAKSKGFDGKIYISMGDGTCRSAVPGQRNGGV